jgi:hypothetical protein
MILKCVGAISQGAPLFASTAVIFSAFAPLANPPGMTTETPSEEIGIPAACVATGVSTACVDALSVGDAVNTCSVAATTVPTSSTRVGVGVAIVPAENEQPHVPMTTPRITNKVRFFIFLSFPIVLTFRLGRKFCPPFRALIKRFCSLRFRSFRSPFRQRPHG